MEASATVDLPTWNLLVGVLIPLLVGVLTKKVSSQGLKSVMNFGLSALTGASGAVIANGGNIPDLKAFVYSIAMTWGTAIVSYYGFTKPTGIADTVTEKTKNIGIGKPPLETEDKGSILEGEVTAAAIENRSVTSGLISTGVATSNVDWGRFQLVDKPDIEALNENVGERGTVTFATTGGDSPGTIPEPESVGDQTVAVCGSHYHGEYCILPPHGPEVTHDRRPR